MHRFEGGLRFSFSQIRSNSQYPIVAIMFFLVWSEPQHFRSLSYTAGRTYGVVIARLKIKVKNIGLAVAA